MIESVAPRSSPISDYFDSNRRQILTNFDFRLLAVVRELHRTRSVSHVAERLELTLQSSPSAWAAKLRKYFNDPLFVRTSQGMEPTPRALQIIRILGQAENLLQTAFDQSLLFCPQTSDRVFRIQSTDVAQVTLAPRLAATFELPRHPRVSILQRIWSRHTQTPGVGRARPGSELHAPYGLRLLPSAVV